MSTPTTVFDLLQTPLYRRASVFGGPLVHLLDAVEFREGEGTTAVDDLLETATSLLDMGLELWPKEESFHLLEEFLVDLEQEDEFLEGECLVLSLSNKAILTRQFAARMIKCQYDLLSSCKLKKAKLNEMLERCNQKRVVRKERLHTVFRREVEHWLMKVPLPTSSDQPTLQNKLKAFLADV